VVAGIACAIPVTVGRAARTPAIRPLDGGGRAPPGAAIGIAIGIGLIMGAPAIDGAGAAGATGAAIAVSVGAEVTGTSIDGRGVCWR
ncbi:hypothetical protein, partial [Escherichia coli]|uniref:hypothetical protein n=1 Tax=Escherichia coli TaxID=562 RepID=UPI0028A00243